jgi:hypothetical protein
MGSQRHKVDVYALEQVSDGYGGHTDKYTLHKSFYSTLQANKVVLSTDPKGSLMEQTLWLKATVKIEDLSNKLAVINNVEYFFTQVLDKQNRHWYEVKLASGGGSFAD